MRYASIKKLITIFVLVSCNGLLKCTESSWINSASDSIKSVVDMFNSKEINPFIIKATYQESVNKKLPGKECPKLKLLDPLNIEKTRREIEQCTDLSLPCNFSEYSKFRTIDGSCNNLNHPSWGMSNICLKRILPFDYADNVSSPRESCTGKPLPNARLISNVFHKERKQERDNFTTHFMEWGQMVSHDISLNDFIKTPVSGSNHLVNCCENGPVYDDRCISIPVPPSDPFFPKYGVTCIDFPRTFPCRLCKGGKRIHSNKNTAYHDLSLVYGNTDEAANELRSKSRGMLKMQWNHKSGPMPPTVSKEEICISPPHERKCYHTGDPRVNQNLFLLTVHIYMLRHHNFICEGLNNINPHWDDERLYQEARRINIAIAQYITFADYLPNVLGEIMQKDGLHVLSGERYTRYNRNLDASTVNEFSAFAGRYGHTQIPPILSEIDRSTGKKENIFLRDYFYRPFGYRYGQFDQIAKGMSIDNPKKRDVSLTDDVRNFLYRLVHLNETTGIDLAALSILRGRDHGIPGYTYYLHYLLNMTVHTFDDLKGIIPDESVDLLEELYESVHDVDVYSAGLAEYHIAGGLVGPTFMSVLRNQYKRTKFGDRYWFEHGNEAGSFTPEQLVEIKRSSLSRILCDTTRITEIQRNVFYNPSFRNPIVPCANMHRFNFLLWLE